MSLIEFIESTAIATFVRESPSIFGYTAVLSLHAMGLAIVVGVNAVVSLRLLGVLPSMRLAPMVKFFPIMWLGFWVNALSGVALFMANASGMLVNPSFYLKLTFVAAAIWVLYMTRRRVFGDPALLDAGQVPPVARKLAGLSLAFWLLAIIFGRLTAYPHFITGLFS